MGLVRVTFPQAPDAKVYVYGKDYGAVGEKLQVPCGRSFLRVGKLPGPAWLSQGSSVLVQCRAVTEVTLQPTP